MVTRRTLLKQGVCATLSAATARTLLPTARAQSAAPADFDFYISPTGDDVLGAGTLASPWSLNAFNNTSTRAKYAGKRVGLIQGLYQNSTSNGVTTSIYNLLLPGGGITHGTLFQVQGGTPSSPTYIASCDSSGRYLARAAVIDCAQPGTGTLPTTHDNNGLGVIGQDNNGGPGTGGGTQPTVWGYMTIDGLEVLHFVASALNAVNPGGLSGIVFKNNHLHDSNAQIGVNNNPGAIRTHKTLGMIITNNLIHDCTTNTAGTFHPWAYNSVLCLSHLGGPSTYSSDLQVYNNTCYNSGPIDFKNNILQGTNNIYYNYIDCGSFGSGGHWPSTGNNTSIRDVGGYAGATVNVFGNLLLGMTDVVLAAQGTTNFYNNTFVGTANQSQGWNSGSDGTTLATFNLWNNIIYQVVSYNGGNGSTSQFGYTGYTGTWSTDYNSFGAAMVWRILGTPGVSIATMRATYGQEVHSTVGTIPLAFANGTGPTSVSGVPNIASWKPSNAMLTIGKTGGLVGALNSVGLAFDGSGNIIGCNFPSFPGPRDLRAR
jgi:hypothetical protein